jgi:hypothetical protein
VRTGLDPSQICERGDDSDGSVPTHAQASAVVEENDACNAVVASRFAQQCANHRFGGTRFGDKGTAEGVVIALEHDATLLHVAISEFRAAFDDGSGGLTAGV